MKSIATGAFVVLMSTWMVVGTAAAQFDLFGGDSSKTIAYFKLKGPVTETPVEIPPMFGGAPPLSMKTLLTKLKEARQDNDIAAVIVDLEQAALGLGQLEELRRSISAFAAVDKDVFVHADTLRTGTYALATSASSISLTPTGDLWLMGLYGEAPYLRGMLDKLGLAADMEQCGDFKSAGETLTRTGPSPEAERMTEWLLTSLYDSIVKMIADGRGLSEKRVRALIDDGPYTAEEALELGLIDAVEHRQDFIKGLERRFGADVKIDTGYAKADGLDLPTDPLGLIQFAMNLFNPSSKTYTKASIAIIYVEGMIVTGEGEASPFGPSSGAFSTTIRKALDKAANDDTVKAVVLRVDSGGGSALASEIILDATKRVAKKKPLIASMGNVAASGGYYVTCGADAVFADATTITASIGVIAGKIVTTGGWDKLGINWHAHQRGKMAGLFSSAAPFTDDERAKLVGYMNEIYDTFKQHVVNARGDRLAKPIDELAGGRVYTGAQALELGLVDKIGGFDDAIKAAAKKAGISEYELRVIPEPPTIFDIFLSGMKDEQYASLSHRPSPRLGTSPLVEALLPGLFAMDPARVKSILSALRQIELLQQESVLTVMPYELLIR